MGRASPYTPSRPTRAPCPHVRGRARRPGRRPPPAPPTSRSPAAPPSPWPGRPRGPTASGSSPTPGTRCTGSAGTAPRAAPTGRARKRSAPHGTCSPPPAQRSPVASTSRAAAAHRRWRRAAPAATTTQRVLGAAAAAALAIDAYVHFSDAGYYTAVTTSVLSQATLFRVQAALAAALALALLARPSRLWWAAGVLVGASAFGAVLLYRYVDVGALGPIPNMYEPTWVSPGKLASAWAEGAAAILAATGLLVAVRARRHRCLHTDHAGACPATRGSHACGDSGSAADS